MKKIFLFFPFLFLFLNQSFAQRTCSHNSHMQELLQDHDYAVEHQNRQLNFQSIHDANAYLNRAQCSNPVTLPMAVHYQGLSSGYDEACLIALAEAQIQILNEDYGGYNADISTWNNSASQFYPGVNNGETCIAFCLATQNHPNGYGLSNGDVAVTFNATSGTNVSAWSGYINIYVYNIGGGTLGFTWRKRKMV